MAGLGVDAYGIAIMAPKALGYCIRVNEISVLWANILKQEMLSLGGDAALARDVLTGRKTPTDCLLIGNLAQFNRLNEKLKQQPFGLKHFADELRSALANYQKDAFTVGLGRHRLRLGERTRIMGVVNLTPDSFSADGLSPKDDIVAFVRKMVTDGADIIDVGGESSRPGAKKISVKEEIARTIPVIRQLAKKVKAPLSIDTCKPEVARAALDNGACLINDITGLRDPRMAKVAARAQAAVVIMHMQGTPSSMQKAPRYGSLFDELLGFFRQSIDRAQQAGVRTEKIILDPGIGFGKTHEHNLALIRGLREFKVLGRPLLVGLSRKSFLGTILGEPVPGKRVTGSVAASVIAAQQGAHIVRVHDVKETRQALEVADALRA